MNNFVCIGDYLFQVNRIAAVYPRVDNDDFDYCVDIDAGNGNGCYIYYISSNEYVALVNLLRSIGLSHGSAD